MTDKKIQEAANDEKGYGSYQTPLEIIEELVFIKKYKDLNGKDELYKYRQPEAWRAAIEYIRSSIAAKLAIERSDAIEFYEWALIFRLGMPGNRDFTTQELYELFKESKK